MDKRTFGRRIRLFREHQGLSREQLGEAVGVSYDQVVNWELGRRGTPTGRLGDIYTALGVTPEQFWDENYVPGELFGNNREKKPTTGVIGAVLPRVDDDGRAVACPRCKNNDFSDRARYCPACAFPLLNVCSGEDRHVNPAHARFCETCGAPTFWGMDDVQLEKHGVPPL